MRWDSDDEMTHIEESLAIGEFAMSYEEDYKNWNPVTLDTPEQDARIGKHAVGKNGFEGIVESIIRHSDGWECIQIRNGAIGQGGLLPEEVTILD